jgi:hypothetical protein
MDFLSTERRFGRPHMKPTKAQRNQVALLSAAGWSHKRIAGVLGIARNTLARRFAWELEHGGDRKRCELLEAADKAARKGNVSAIRWLMARFDAAYAAEVTASKAEAAASGQVIPFSARR